MANTISTSAMVKTSVVINPSILAVLDDTVLCKKVAVAKKIVKAMHEGIAHFKFVKEDGSVREAFGTLDTNLISSLYGKEASEDRLASRQQNGISVSKDGNIYTRYYDLTKDENGKVKGWRAFRWDRVISIK